MIRIISVFIVMFIQVQFIKAQIRLSVGGGVNLSNIHINGVDFIKPHTATNYFLSVRP